MDISHFICSSRKRGRILMINIFFSNNFHLDEEHLTTRNEIFKRYKNFILCENLAYGNLNDRKPFFNELIFSSTFFDIDINDVKKKLETNEKNISSIEDKLNKGESANLFFNPNSSNDICLLSYLSYVLLNNMKLEKANILLYELPYLYKIKESYCIFSDWWNFLAGNSLEEKCKYENINFFKVYADYWSELLRSKSKLRVLLNGYITNIDENIFDDVILNTIKTVKAKNEIELILQVDLWLRDKYNLELFFIEKRVKQILIEQHINI